MSPVCRSLSMCCSPRVPVSNAHGTSLSLATQDELRRKHKGYLAENPDVNRLLNDLMSQVLFHKPDDIFAFAAEKFNSFERKVRPKWREKVGGRDGGGGRRKQRERKRGRAGWTPWWYGEGLTEPNPNVRFIGVCFHGAVNQSGSNLRAGMIIRGRASALQRKAPCSCHTRDQFGPSQPQPQPAQSHTRPPQPNFPMGPLPWPKRAIGLICKAHLLLASSHN